MANLGGELFGDILKVAGETSLSKKPIVADETATDWNQVRVWMQNNAREFDNATNLAESAADNFGLYEGDNAEIPTEVFDLAHEVMYESEFAPVSHTDGEFSDIGGVPKLEVQAASPAMAIGDEAFGLMPTGAKFRGEIESMNNGQVIIVNERGQKRPFAIDKVKSQADEDAQNREMKQRDQAEATEEEQRKFDELVGKLTLKPEDVQGSYDALANYLMSSGNYKLKLDIGDNQLQEFEDKYFELTGEQLNAQSRPKTRELGGWRLRFPDSPEVRKYIPWPIDVARTDLRPLTGGKVRAIINPKTNIIALDYNEPVWELIKRGLRYKAADDAQELVMQQHASSLKSAHHSPEEAELPAAVEVPEGGTGAKQLPPVETKVDDAEIKEAGFNFFFPGQVVKEFYPELQHEIVDYPNENNSPMIEDIDITAALETPKLSYVSTSPAGAVGIGRDGKPQVLDGAPLRKENDIRGGMFLDEFHQQYEGVPGALLTVASKVAAKDEQHQFEVFLKKVMAEIAAAFVAAYKVTGRSILNMVPGVGEVQLAQVEQPSSLSSFNIVNTGSRVKYLLDKLNDSDVKDAINKARAQAAVWVDDPNGGFVYEVFARAESIDTDSMILKYTFIIGTKETE